MVHYAQILLLAATITAPVTQVFAADIDETWRTPGFVSCVGGLGSKPSREAVYDCHNKHKSDKRAIPDNNNNNDNNTTTTAHDLNVFDTRDGKASWNADCESDSLPKNFEIVTNIRANAAQYCEDLKQGVIDAGVSVIDQKLDNAVSKTLQELHGGKGVLLQMAFALTPQGRGLMASKKITEDKYHEVCTNAMTALATKGQGCTRDLHAYNSAKAKGYQVTGATSGAMDITWEDKIFGFVSNMYYKP